MKLLLDIGNTAIKWRAENQGGRLSRDEAMPLPDLDESPDAVWVASVADAGFEQALAHAVVERWQVQPWFARSGSDACGVSNSYEEPGRMGVDRWLAMIAAFAEVRGACCVVDAGSALTIDFLDISGCHRGGYILPGLAMMERALLGDTARVRFGESARDEMSPGTSTESAVFNGLQLAQVGAVATALDRFGEGGAIVFTGGDGEVAQRLLDRGGQFIESLVLDGLEILGSEVAS